MTGKSTLMFFSTASATVSWRISFHWPTQWLSGWPTNCVDFISKSLCRFGVRTELRQNFLETPGIHSWRSSIALLQAVPCNVMRTAHDISSTVNSTSLQTPSNQRHICFLIKGATFSHNLIMQSQSFGGVTVVKAGLD